MKTKTFLALFVCALAASAIAQAPATYTAAEAAKHAGKPDAVANAISNAIGFAKFYSRSHNAVIRVYDEAGNVIETHEHAGDFKEWLANCVWHFEPNKKPPSAET